MLSGRDSRKHALIIRLAPACRASSGSRARMSRGSKSVGWRWHCPQKATCSAGESRPGWKMGPGSPPPDWASTCASPEPWQRSQETPSTARWGSKRPPSSQASAVVWHPMQLALSSAVSRLPRGSSSSSPPGVGIQPFRAWENESRNSRSRAPGAKETGVNPRRPDPKTASTGSAGGSAPGTPKRTPPSVRRS